MSLPYNRKLISRAKELRKSATRQENKLWYDFLSSYSIRFQRQKTIDSFIVDFYCHEAKLVIELDGSQHYTGQGIEHDRARSNILKKYSLTILRFSNSDIDNHFNGVCEAIDAYVKKKVMPNDKL